MVNGSGSDGEFDWHYSKAPPEEPPPLRASGRLGPQDIREELARSGFEILEELGRGGMGVVYRARELASGREVAIKLLLHAITPRSLERFRREGVLTAALDHEGIVRVHSAGMAGGCPYLAYELVLGARPFDDVLGESDLEGRVRLIRDAAWALGHAHERGVVHRDVKPANVLVDRAGRVRIADFGLATAAELDRLTKTGELVGTPTHMSPEQFTGARDMGPATDVWALGVILYQALTGQLPFAGGSLLEQARLVVDSNPTPPRDLCPEIEPALEAICLAALVVDPAQRYPDAGAMAEDLDRYVSGTSLSSSVALRELRAPRRVRASLALGVGLLGLVLTLLVLVLGGDERPVVASDPLELLVPDALVVYEETFPLTGRAGSGSEWLLLRVNHEPAVRVRGTFSVDVNVEPGESTISIRLEDGRGAVASAECRVHYRPEPRWFHGLALEERPELPLPTGLTFGLHPGDYLWGKDGSVLRYVPAGTFVMGRDRDPPADAEPVRTLVTLSRGYFIGKYELTRGRFRAFVEDTSRVMPPKIWWDSAERDDHPIVNLLVTYAEDYCRWAGLRLPTSAEWECAARGRDGRLFPWGDSPPAPNDANFYGDEDGFVQTAKVGSFKRDVSPFGCYDVAGNVSEWVADMHRPVGNKPLTDPVGERRARERDVRGECWTDKSPIDLAYRGGVSVDVSGATMGFRVCLSER